MAITGPVSTPTTAASTTNVTSITVNTPASLVAGDLLFFGITHQNATVDAGNPTGFSSTIYASGTTTGLALMVYTRICDGSEAASYTSQTLTSARTSALMVAYRGVNVGVIKDVANSSAGTGTTSTTFNSITPVTPGAWVLGWAAQSFASGVTPGTFGTSTNMTIDAQFSSTQAAAINVLVGVGHFAWSSGAFTPTSNNSAATTRTIGVSTALRPVGPIVVMSPRIGV